MPIVDAVPGAVPAGCDSCTLCCKLLEVGDLVKPPDQYCPHCVVDHGCRIHADRPGACQAWDCLWLVSQQPDSPYPPLDPELRPDRCGVVIADPRRVGGSVQATADPAAARPWHAGPAAVILQAFSLAGATVVVHVGTRRWAVFEGAAYEVLTPVA